MRSSIRWRMTAGSVLSGLSNRQISASRGGSLHHLQPHELRPAAAGTTGRPEAVRVRFADYDPFRLPIVQFGRAFRDIRDVGASGEIGERYRFNANLRVRHRSGGIRVRVDVERVGKQQRNAGDGVVEIAVIRQPVGNEPQAGWIGLADIGRRESVPRCTESSLALKIQDLGCRPAARSPCR